MNRRILGVATLQLLLGALVLRSSPATGGGINVLEAVAFTGAFAVAGLLPIHLEFRRSAATVVLDEAVWIVALFAMEPMAVVACAVTGDALARVILRQSGVKTAYNLASVFLAASFGSMLFAAAGPADAGDPRSWIAALASVTALSGSTILSISTVLLMVEPHRARTVLSASPAPVAVSTATNASLGLATVALFHVSPLGPLLMVPLLAAVLLGPRRQALRVAEHLRFERLYEASARSGRLVGFEEALAALAVEARGLMTGSVALCCALRGDGTWTGMQVDDSGTSQAPPEAVSALVQIARPGEAEAVAIAALPEQLRDVVPRGVELVWASPPAPDRRPVVLAVTREIFPDEQAKGRADVLAAFAGHAALVVANTLLFEEVEQALRRQIDLNRQKDEFVAAVSHELRTPLTTVLGVVSTARRLRSRLEPDALDELLGRAAQQGDRLRRLIDELLLVAAAEHGTLAVQNNPVDPRDLAEEVRVELDGRAGGRLRVRTGGDVGRLVTDGDKLRQILINLVENAVKYAPDGPIEVNVRRVGQTIEWCVMDHGPGIPAEERDRVFDCFVQLDQSSTRRQGGTGLGLYLCRRLADLLGGDLELTETPGGGCRFTLRLPAPSTPSASPADPMSPQEASVPAPTQGAAA